MTHGEQLLRALIRSVAIIAALSVLLTIWFIVGMAGGRGLRSLAGAGPLGLATLLAWVVTLVVGPFAAVQLWRYRESGRRAAIAIFACGLAYYILGFFLLRAPGADPGQILLAALMYALPLILLALPATRRACRT